jgi:DNA-binding GntR family transcriptional regulator
MDHLLKDELISRRRGSGTIVLPLLQNISTSYRTEVIGNEHNYRKDRRIISVSYEKVPKKMILLPN